MPVLKKNYTFVLDPDPRQSAKKVSQGLRWSDPNLVQSFNGHIKDVLESLATASYLMSTIIIDTAGFDMLVDNGISIEGNKILVMDKRMVKTPTHEHTVALKDNPGFFRWQVEYFAGLLEEYRLRKVEKEVKPLDKIAAHGASLYLPALQFLAKLPQFDVEPDFPNALVDDKALGKIALPHDNILDAYQAVFDKWVKHRATLQSKEEGKSARKATVHDFFKEADKRHKSANSKPLDAGSSVAVSDELTGTKARR